ncbi:hypothetical protein [Actinocorallia sp. A-T 12471]|uniref:NAD(P)H-dependent amine dehydrogenase family protein n=1 Tax=Actinocorallia sp. A-T 12471 TaxID=3089813 RepID=UPI0029D05E5E|nr:hypothetical protein [Actinocorallia sp. A-T 12471]MDX6741107.1 hypothetical protein [Actinocorallia sp. A-T 12471]
MGGGRYRVVQWATGNIGTKALREVIAHPGLDLVGLYAHAEDKAGKDAGEIAVVGATGVRATRDIGEIVALKPDCVLYMPLACDFDAVCRLLESGANVVTTRGEFHRPASLDPAVRARIEAACATGGTSIHSTGSSPGFITEAVPLVLTSIQRRLDGLVIDEYADLSRRDSPALLFDVMGFGRPPAEIGEARLAHGKTSFGPSLAALADALGIPLDGVEAAGEVAVTPETVEIAAGTLAAGTVAAQRMIVHGLRGGVPVLTFRANWYCATDVEPAWDLRATGWRIRVDGDAPLDVQLAFPVPVEELGPVTPGYTANRAVNAVPFVCEAAPGIRTTSELPQITAAFG